MLVINLSFYSLPLVNHYRKVMISGRKKKIQFASKDKRYWGLVQLSKHFSSYLLLLSLKTLHLPVFMKKGHEKCFQSRVIKLNFMEVTNIS